VTDVEPSLAQARAAAEQATDAASLAGQARHEAGAAEAGAVQAGKSAARAGDKALAAAATASSVDPDDPLLDTAVRRIEAQVSDDLPYGVPGPPLSQRSPFRIAFAAALGLALAYGLVQALVQVESVLVLMLISAFLAVGLNPAVEFFQRRGLKRAKAVGAVVVVVLLFFLGVALAVVPVIVEQGQQLLDSAPDYLTRLQNNPRIARLDSHAHLIKRAQDYLANSDPTGDAFGSVLGVGRFVFGAVFSTITVLTLTLYFMASLPLLKENVYRLVPRSRRARFGLLSDDILARFGGYVAGCLTIAAIAGSTGFVVLLVTGVPYPLALALLIAVTDLIPLVGATIGAAVATLLAFAVSIPVGIGVGVWFLLYQQFESYLLYPRIMKRSVDVSSVTTVVAILIGASLLGVLGALLAIPIAAAIQLVLEEVVVPRQEAS